MNEYTLQTGKIMKTIDGKIVTNKQYAFDYDGKKANIVLKDNKDLHEYKLSNKDINDMFTRIMRNKDLSLKDRLKNMIEHEVKTNNTNKRKKRKTKKRKSKSKTKTKSKSKTKTKRRSQGKSKVNKSK
jgi:hypothetical protein|tara:strand:- start:1178 stop:1561 length:384 start_codon:yes stop_codon:yes gene_type:complete